MPLVTADGVHPDDEPLWTTADAPGAAVLLDPGQDPRVLTPHLDRIALIGIGVASFADGRGFSAARRLRAAGYTGRLRLVGPIVADQWPLARAVGFDEAAIPPTVAMRQPPSDWRRAEQVRAAPPRARRQAGA